LPSGGITSTGPVLCTPTANMAAPKRWAPQSVMPPYILPHNGMLYAVLRKAHTILACLFSLTFLAHFGAILFHTLVVRDGMVKRMAPWNIRRVEKRTS